MTEQENIFELLSLMFKHADSIHRRFDPDTPLLPIAAFFTKKRFFSTDVIEDKRSSRVSVISTAYALDLYNGDYLYNGLGRKFTTFSIKMEKYNNGVLDMNLSRLIRISLPRLALIIIETLEELKEVYNIQEEYLTKINSDIVDLLTRCKSLTSPEQNYRSILFRYNIDVLDYIDKFKSSLIEVIVSENNSCFYVTDDRIFENTLIELFNDLINLPKNTIL